MPSDVAALTLKEWRTRAAEVLQSVCPADIDSPSAQRVCQGRQFWKGPPPYSGCADLAHFLYHELGLRHPNINREDFSTKEKEWRIGKNVSLLASWHGVAQDVPPEGGYPTFLQGDVIIRWNLPSTKDAHVQCILASYNGSYDIAHYGQAKPLIGKVGYVQNITRGKRVHKWLPLEMVLKACGKEVRTE
jgi:hypothetical protein